MKTEQEELRKSEARYRSLFENAVDAIFIATAEGILAEVNRSGERLLGYGRGKLIGKAIVDVLQPEEMPHFLNTRQALLEGKTLFDEWILLRKDGTFVQVEISASMLPDKQFQAFVRDITKRKQLEESRKRQIRHTALRADVQAAISSGGKTLQSVLQSNMESIVRHLDAAIARVWTLEENENILQLQASAGIYTRIDQSYSRFPVGQFKVGEIAAQKKSFFSNAISEIEIIDKEWAVSEGLVSFAGLPLIVNDKVVGVAIVFSRLLLTEDILEAFESIAAVVALGIVNKRAENELRANQQLLQAIFDNTPTHIHVKDLNGRFMMTNRAFEQSLCLSREELLGKNVYDVWKISPFKDETKEEVDDIPAFDSEVIKAGKAVQKENVTMIDGEETTYLMTKCPLKSDADEPYSLLTIATDITAIKRAENELRRLQTELAHAARVMTIGALTTSIAHEVNQPLAAVVTNGNAALRWLAVDPPDLEETRDAVNRIIRDGIRASEVIKHTRTLLKKSSPQKHSLDINEIVRETIALAQYEIQKNKILLETQFSEELPMILGDKIQLQQVLLNLIMNAIEAMNAARDGAARLSVETRKDGKDNIRVAVKDSGIGLDAGNLDKIFESFHTTKQEGMGMGLSISRSIIETHDGKIWATANEDKGATFQFTLPVETHE